MANRFLKGLAVAAGTGLAMGLSSGRARSRVTDYHAAPGADPDPLPTAESDEDFLNIEPLLDRLESLEARIDRLERRTVASPSAPSAPAAPAVDYTSLMADLDRRVDENTRELVLLRESVNGAERRATESVASMERKVLETKEEIPALVERTVTARFEDLRARFSAEMEQTHQRTLASFERAIDEKISARIGSIESALAAQAGSIEALRVRATETDTNLQRLVSAIEKLCERAQLIAPIPEPPRAPMPRPGLESQFQDAMRREEPVEIAVSAPAFTGGPEPRKSRFLFRNLIVAGFSLLASRFVR